MIDLRYHIVSIVAVFLALGLGIMLGSSVVSDAVDARLSEDATRARQARDVEKQRADDVTEERDDLRNLVTDQIVPWSLDGRLSDSQVVFVTDGAERPQLREHVEDALVAAGAQLAGTIALRDKWDVVDEEGRASLEKAFTDAGLEGGTGEEPVADALRTFGQRFVDATGRQLIAALTDEGFLSVDQDREGEFPPASSVVIVLSPSRRAESPSIPHAEALALALGETTPTLVVTDRPEGQSLVTTLRQQDDDVATLSTFDAATDETDPGGVGVIASLVAATDGQGGDWGEEGERFIPPNAAQG